MNFTKFVQEYIKLDNDRDAGPAIWKLCQMSAEVVVARRPGENLEYYKERKQQNGLTKQLALAIRRGEDVIERRAFAWRMWERMLKIPLQDENGDELDLSPLQLRERLFYSHFSEIGRKVESNSLTIEQGVFYLVQAAKEAQSVLQMIGKVTEFTDTDAEFNKQWEGLRKKAKRLAFGHPQIVGRRKKLLVELVSTDWKGKEKK